MPKIALNGRFSGTSQPTGTQTAAFNLFDALVRREGRADDLVIFADDRYPGVAAWAAFPRVTFVQVPFQDWSRGRAQVWEQVRLPSLCRKWRCEVAHHPINTCPIWQNGVRTVVTLHDLNFLLHPEWYSWKLRLVFSLFCLPGVRRAQRVVTISHFVEKQIVEALRIPAARLRMVHNGVKSLDSPAAPSAEPYVLCVGSLQPHKNLTRIIKAFQAVRRESPDLQLRIVGRPQAQFTADAGLPDLLESPGVRVLGYLSDAELAAAYRGTAVFCYPSLEEGFGLPMLEAMSLGAPVITSNTSCLPEIGGDAALYVDPRSIDQIAGRIREVLEWTPEQRALVVERGCRHAREFSWPRAADEYLAIYHELLDQVVDGRVG
jgi:glycosyltransferase involved in cell wall biosynthesis